MNEFIVRLRASISAAIAILLAGSFHVGVVHADDAASLEGRITQIDELLKPWDHPDRPGCAIGVVWQGKLVYSKGVGSANLEYPVANSPRTLFGVASMSKAFTSVCLALLMDEGKLAPDDALRKFLPELHAFDPPIQIQHAVRCRSGIWDQISLPWVIGWENAPRQHPHTESDFLTLLCGQRTLPFRPGEEFRYSSGDYFLLSEIVQRISGKPLNEFAKERLFEPLGMARTFYAVDPTRVVPQPAVGHYRGEDGDWRLWRPMADWMGGGGLQTCVEDLVRWDQAFRDQPLARGPRVDEFFRDGALLENRACLDVDAYRKLLEPDSSPGPVGRYRGLRCRQFTGGAWGTSSAMTQFPDHNLAVICLSNSDDITAWSVTRRIAAIFLGDQLQPATAGRPASERRAVELPIEKLRAKTGHYRLRGAGSIWQIALEGNSLVVIDHMRAKTPLRTLGGNEFDPDGPRFYATTVFEFSPATPTAPKSFVSKWEEPDHPGRIRFDAVELVEPSRAELVAYTGEYASDELAATYRLEVRNNQLWLRVNSRRWEQLDPTVRDEFVPHARTNMDGRIIRFHRNDQGTVTDLSVDYYRVNGVKFVKR